MTEAERNKRNLNAHQEARLAMAVWHSEYAAQNGGSMDFWDSLSERKKLLCRGIAADIRKASPEAPHTGGQDE
jgi:hypothetical protein